MTKIFTGVEAGVRMPDDGELHQLELTVYRTFPQLDPRFDRRVDKAIDPKQRNRDWTPQNEFQHNRAFKAIFWAVGQLGRLRAPETKRTHAVTWWTAHTEEMLRNANMSVDVRAPAFTTAVLAHGDVPHTVSDRWPLDVLFGLTYSTDIKATDKWRNVLKTGKLLPGTGVQVEKQSIYPLPKPVVYVAGSAVKVRKTVTSIGASGGVRTEVENF